MGWWSKPPSERLAPAPERAAQPVVDRVVEAAPAVSPEDLAASLDQRVFAVEIERAERDSHGFFAASSMGRESAATVLEVVSRVSLRERVGVLPLELECVRDVLARHGDRMLVRVKASHQVRSAAAHELSRRGLDVVWVGEVHGRATSFLDCDVLVDALASDVRAALAGFSGDVERAVLAVAAGAKVVSRDVLEVVVQSGFHREVEVLVLSDRRLLTVSSEARVPMYRLSRDREGVLGAPACQVSVLDVGVPVKVVVYGDRVVVQGTRSREVEVELMIDGRRQVSGYRSVPLEVSLPDPVGPSVLLSLVELGAGSLVEQV